MYKRLELALVSISVVVVISACSGSGASREPYVAPANACTESVADFSYQISQDLYTGNGVDGWGPQPNTMLQQSWVTSCGENNPSWTQERVLAAADYWVNKKVNYCHHHVPTWFPPAEYQINDQGPTVGCPLELNIYPGSPTENEAIRWNYTGLAPDSIGYWESAGQWYGLDCSDFSALTYNWALGRRFSTDMNIQGGQALTESQITPNESGFSDAGVIDTYGFGPAGHLVCMDGTTAPEPTDSTGCDGHGGFISVYNSSGQWESTALTDSVLENLQPGDILYIATNSPHSATIEHVIIWTGHKIGDGAIESNAIAPEQFCTWNNEWMPVDGNWIIVDSTYQGPDYRNFTYCFYRQNVWGVRRVIGS
jgi:hypothetical protein